MPETNGSTLIPAPPVPPDSGPEVPEEKQEHSNGVSFPVVGVGASAGGLEAFSQLLRNLPRDTGMAFVLVQHLDPSHPSILPHLLSRETVMPVNTVESGVPLKPNQIYVMPENTSVELKDGSLRLTPRSDTRGQHLPIDLFFRSMASARGAQAIGVILSGTASDGALGCGSIKEAGGITFAQEPKSAKFASMPRNAIAAGSIDYVLSPPDIAIELARIRSHRYIATDDTRNLAPFFDGGEAVLQKILALLRTTTRVDFSTYKQTTIRRRIVRRMLLQKVEELRDYLEYLTQNPAEVQVLFDDILINVTQFFRDPDTFAYLQSEGLPRIFRERQPGDPVRIWVPGCSTGEEVYSMAICLLEYLAERKLDAPPQIFATDVSERSIEVARSGTYSENAVAEVSPERMRRFFVKTELGYQIVKRVRDLCIFARHNLVKDPPFSKLDLISCRNVLIYFGVVMQKKAMPIFHYALKPNGLLLLGTSETIGSFSDLFAPLNPSHRLYSRKFTSTRMHLDLGLGPGDRPAVARPEAADHDVLREGDLEREADKVVLTKFAQPGVVVNDELDILQFRGQTSPYLEVAPGNASLNLANMAPLNLLVELREAIQSIRLNNRPIHKRGIRIKRDGAFAEFDINVAPLKTGVGSQRFYLILFQSLPEDRGPEDAGDVSAQADQLEVTRLVNELESTRRYLQSIIEAQEASNEELRSANEEIQSSNEELQSTNEELETAKEELQSTNEELNTVNEELQSRNVELSLTNDDFSNLLSSVNIPIVMLDSELCVRRFTPMAGKIFHLAAADVGRPIREINFPTPDLGLLPILHDVMDTLRTTELEVQDRGGRWYSLRVRPYRTSDNRIDGVVIILVDMDEIKRNLEEVRRSRDFEKAVVETVREPLLILDPQLRIKQANPSFYSVFRMQPADVEGKILQKLGTGEWADPQLRDLLKRILPNSTRLDDFEIEFDLPEIGHKVLCVNARKVSEIDHAENTILLAFEDITERKQVEELRSHAHEFELNQSAAMLRTETEYRERLSALTASLINAQEEEQRRISRELHDDVNQKLAVLEMEIEGFEANNPDISSKTRAHLQAIGKKVGVLSDDVRNVAYRLHPSALDHLGVAVALRAYCLEFSRRESSEIKFSQKKVPRIVPQDVALCIYRVAQEAIWNAHRHSGTKSIKVLLEGAVKGLVLTITDGGDGFDAVQPTKRSGLGIISMQERVRALKGEFKLESIRGKGTTVTAFVPITREPL